MPAQPAQAHHHAAPANHASHTPSAIASGSMPAAGGGKAQILTLAVGNPAHGGHCVARPADDPSGRVIFVRGALPGERVRAVLTQCTSKTWRAEAIEVLEASPDRVEPSWAAGLGEAGGTELAHVALPAQRTWKRWVLADCLRRIGGEALADAVTRLDPAAGGTGGSSVVIEALASEQEAEASADPAVREYAGAGTRTRIGLEVGPQGRLGMHGFRSSQIVEVESLPLAVEAIQGLGLVGRHARHEWLSQLRPGQRVEVVAPSVGEPRVIIGQTVLGPDGQPAANRYVSESVDARALGLGHLGYRLQASGFWQIHRQAPATLLEAVVRGALTGDLRGCGPLPEQAGAGLHVLELFSGAGLFTLPLAAAGAEVTSLEGSEAAVRDARRNMRGLAGARLMAGRVTPASVSELAAGAGRASSGQAGTGTGMQAAGPQVVVLDPPRKGAGAPVMEAIAHTAAERVVMVACDPAAFSRDAAALLGAGFTLRSMRAFDLFPHTHHFETLAVLERD